MVTRWTVDIASPAAADFPPLADGQRAFIALRTGQILARALANGAEVWRRDLATEHPMALDAGLLLVATGDSIRALKAEDGSLAWEVPRAAAAAPIVAHAGWLVAVSGDKLLALRAADGTIVWERAIGKVVVAPVINGDRLYVSAQDGRVMAIALGNGASVWERHLPGPAGQPFATSDRVYAAAGDKRFYCLLEKNGDIDWSYRVGAEIKAAPVGDDQHVYFIALDNVLRAHDRISGAQVWQHGLRRRPGAGPALIHDWVIVPSSTSPEIWTWTSRGAAGPNLATESNPTGAPCVIDEGVSGARFLVMTGTLASVWQLRLMATTADPPLVPLAVLPGRPVDPRAR